MLSLTCMIMFCIILNTYAQKHSSSEQLHDDSQPRMFVNSKSESVRNNALVVSAQPPTIFQVPMLAAFNPFQLKHQNLEAKDASSQLTDWFQPFRVNLFRPFSISNTDTLLGTVQTYPLATNLTHLGNFGRFMDSNSFLLKLADYDKKHQEIMKNANFGINAPNGLIIPEKINNEKIKGDEITQQNTFTTATTDNGLQDDNVTDTTETAINYYDSDFEEKKIPEMEENDEEIATETDRNNNENLMEKKTFKNKFNDPFWKHFLQINETENTTQNSLDDLKEVVNTLNLSQAQTATFVKIIEKIVDDELKRRHNEELSKSKFTQTSVKPKLAAAKFYEIDSETAKDIDDRYDQEIRPHEKLTVNTRLSFNDQHIIDDYRNGQDEIPETLAAESLKLDSRKEARKKTDYMVREQAEYDRLISGITDATPESGSDYLETKNGQAFNRGLIRTTVKSANTEEPQTTSSAGLQYEKTGLQPVEESYIPKRTMTVYRKVTTIPRTVFERQAEDFRSRLLGMNGFGDIIKALKHGKIGFFERN